MQTSIQGADVDVIRIIVSFRYSTISEAVAEPLVQLDFPSFIKSIIDKPEGPSHCWFNGILDKKSLEDDIFLVLVAGFVDTSSMTEASFVSMLKKISFPSNSFQDTKIPLCSSNICAHLLGRTLKEYIAFPILLANKDALEIACEACYVLFNGSKSSSICYGKEANIMILDKAIKNFRAQKSGTPKFVHNLTSTWVKRTDDFKGPPLCFPLRSLLLCFPGGISVDESGNRLFLSDSNHHRVVVLDGNGMILDSIGSSPGHEDGEFESAKLRRPAASFYHAAEDCLYLVDSENHAIRRADMGKRIVETLYPRSKTNKNSSIWSWILGKLWPRNDLDAKSDELNLDVLVFPWHILKSPNGDLLIFNRSCETLWIMDFASGLIRDVVKGFSNILEICEPLILEKSMLLNQIPNDWLQQQVDAHCSSKRIPYVKLISSVETFQDQIFICDTVAQTVSKLNRNSGSISSFQFSNLGILGFPYSSLSPLERVCAVDAALAGNSIDHIESFNLLPGKIDILLNVDIPEYVDLVEPLSESCIWRQTRGAATEISEADSTIMSSEKVGVAQQWYDEIDHLAFSTSEIEPTIEEGTMSHGEEIPEGKVEICCSVNSSPGTSEVSLLYGSMLKLVSDLLCGRRGQKMRSSLCAQIRGFHSSKPGLAPRSFFGVEDFVDDDNSRPYTYLKGKKSKNPNKHVSFKQRTVAYMEPFTLDVFISKRFVSASITHRVTCKQVAVAGTNSKDIKAVLKSRSDIPACLSVGQILANRAREADVYTASYTPRDRDKFEGKIRAVVQSLIDNGIDIKVYLD